MLWGLISVLRGLAATSQTQIPVPRPQRQTYVTRVLMNKGSILLETPLYRSDRLQGTLTMNIHMAQWQSAKKEKRGKYRSKLQRPFMIFFASAKHKMQSAFFIFCTAFTANKISMVPCHSIIHSEPDFQVRTWKVAVL